MTAEHRAEVRYQRELRRGAFYSALGTAGRLVYVAYIIVATQLFGAEAMGLYSAAFIFTEIATALIAAGLADGVILFGSRDMASGHETQPTAAYSPRVYDLFANAFVVSVGLGLVCIVLAFAFGRSVAEVFWSERVNVVRGIQILAFALPARAIAEICVAATKSTMRMEIGAKIQAYFRPVALLLCALGAKYLGAGWLGLCVSNVVAEVIVAVLALREFGKIFDFAALRSAMSSMRWTGDMLRFSAPHGANHTLGQYLTQVDTLMLSMLGVSPVLVAQYWTASLFVQGLRQFRILFAASLAPVLARHHALREIDAIEKILGNTARWATTLVAVVILFIVGVRDDLLALASASYRGQSDFLLVLLAIPLLNCWLGLSGNVMVATGHSRWILFDALLLGLTNTVLNYLWIPRFGLEGAALASLIANTLIMFLYIFQIRALEGVRWLWRSTLPVWLPLLAAAALYAAVWNVIADGSVVTRVIASAGAVLVFIVTALLLRHPEMTSLCTVARRRLFGA